MKVTIESRKGPPVTVDVQAPRPRTAIRKALEEHEGPAVATVRGSDYVGHKFVTGLIVIRTNTNKEK